MSENYLGTTGTYLMDPDGQFRVKQSDETSGTVSQFMNRLITRDAAQIASQLENKQMKKVAREMLDALERSVRIYQVTGGDLSNIEPARAFLPEDGSMLIEWINHDFRFGFNIEPEIRESGWYVATSEKLGDIGMHGSLSSLKSDDLANLAIRFLKSNT